MEKRRKLMSKERHRKALGISNESFGVEQDMEIISASQFVGLDELQPNIEEEVRLKWERDERLRVANSGGDTGYFKDLDVCLSSFNKKQEFSGGFLEVDNLNCVNSKKKIITDEFSTINIKN